MGYQTRLKGAPVFWEMRICGKWGIATFWGKSVVRGKIVSPSGVLVSPATYLTTTLTHTHIHDNAPTCYAIDNEMIGRRNTTMSAEPGIEPRVVSTRVNHVTNMPTGIYHQCVALDVAFIGACNGRKSTRRKNTLCTTNNNMTMRLLDMLEKAVNGCKHDRILVMGDFNYREIDYNNYDVKADDNSDACKFFDKTLDLYLVQHITTQCCGISVKCADYAVVRAVSIRPSVCPSIPPSIMFMYSVETSKHIFKKFSPSGSHIIYTVSR